MSQTTLLVFMICGTVAALAYWAVWLFTAVTGGSRIRNRLELDSPAIAAAMPAQFDLRETLRRLGAACAKPLMPTTREKQTSLRGNLARAGIYNPGAIRLLAGCKTILLTTGVLLGWSIGTLCDQLLLGLSLGGLFGYLLPVLWIRLRVGKHQSELDYALPDALDLLVVCVEAGLTIDAAIQRVGQELALSHVNLARELAITHMEMRVGVSRSESLKNMARRTQNASVQSLVAMLVQAERFGTSVADSLRIHSESLRSRRQHRAEEKAAKATVKMTFPLVLFIFPATFIVLAGPPVLHLLNSALFK